MKQVIVLLVAAVIGWAGYQYACALSEEIQIKDHITDLVVQHRYDKYDSELVYDILTHIRSKPGTKVRDEDLDIWHSDNRLDVTVHLTYTKTILIPVTKKPWVIHFAPEVKTTVGF